MTHQETMSRLANDVVRALINRVSPRPWEEVVMEVMGGSIMSGFAAPTKIQIRAALREEA